MKLQNLRNMSSLYKGSSALHSFTGKVLQMVLKKSFYKLWSPAWDKVVHPATDKQLYLEIWGLLNKVNFPDESAQIY